MASSPRAIDSNAKAQIRNFDLEVANSDGKKAEIIRRGGVCGDESVPSRNLDLIISLFIGNLDM